MYSVPHVLNELSSGQLLVRNHIFCGFLFQRPKTVGYRGRSQVGMTLDRQGFSKGVPRSSQGCYAL